MKVLKRGTPPEDNIFRGTCNHCRSEIEAERRELNDIQYDQREKGELAPAICPVCKRSMFVYPVSK